MSAAVLTGLRFGRLLVERRGDNAGRRATWWCKCDCGYFVRVRADRLRGGDTRSCGCFARELIAAYGREHNATHRATHTRLYQIHHGMLQRCGYKKHVAYSRYGGAGIRVWRGWRRFEAFRDWALNSGYREDLTLDRKNPRQGYHPGNCRWATYTEQNEHRIFGKRQSHSGAPTGFPVKPAPAIRQGLSV